MKTDERGKVIDYLSVQERIPRSAKKDPCFTRLNVGDRCTECSSVDDCSHGVSVLELFEPQEVVLMVNRFLYQMEYQRDFHRRMERRRSEELAPLKKKVKEMFKLRSWSQATDAQLKAAKAELEKEKETK